MVGRKLHDGVDGNFRGDFTGFVAAHAVGNGKKRRNRNQAVFIMFADMANFSAASEEGNGVGLICGFALGAGVAGSGHRIHLPLLLGEPYAHGYIANGNFVAVFQRGGFRDKAAINGCAIG